MEQTIKNTKGKEIKNKVRTIYIFAVAHSYPVMVSKTAN